jgi:hypothetical protein
MPSGAIIGGVAGTVIPGLGTVTGTAIGSVIDVLGRLVRGRTQHFSASEALTKADAIGTGILSELKSSYSDSDLRKIYPILRQRMLTVLPAMATTLWGASAVRWYVEWIQINTNENGGNGSINGGIHACLTLPAMWILVNMDMASEGEFQRVYSVVLVNSLVYAVRESGAVELHSSPVTPPGNGNVPGGSVVQKAGMGLLIGLALLGAFIYSFFIKKKG